MTTPDIVGVRHRLENALGASVLPRHSPCRLIAVSKGHPEAAVRAAVKAGQLEFGENRVQEAQAKFAALRAEQAGLRLHLIGPLQSNKAREAVGLFDLIHSIDRVRVADAVREECVRQGKDVECLIQLNTGRELQKAGVMPEEAEALFLHCRSAGLKVTGLMCIPPVADLPAPHFAFLHLLAARFGLAELSMGMSHDFEIAARLGATYVRVGSAIFGERSVESTEAGA